MYCFPNQVYISAILSIMTRLVQPKTSTTEIYEFCVLFLNFPSAFRFIFSSFGNGVVNDSNDITSKFDNSTRREGWLVNTKF